MNITLQLLESITHSDIIKNFLIREGLCDQRNQRFFCERTGLFSVRQQGRKMFLHNEIRVSKKNRMFYSIEIGNRDRQYGRQSLFNRQFPSITGFLFLFSPTKRRKISQHILSLAVVILSRFQISRVV